ncbi:hypothetical protein GO491_06060 [Flavobacteriaceae bacterium Ap0902]|nr:hypothetical protein [Flavobacteriaceae bacterium Ap0902]
MKKFLFFLLLSIIGCLHINAQVIIDDTGETNPTSHPSAILELNSTTRGFLPPRLSFAERDAIQNPADGLMIYIIDNEVRCLQVYDGQSWTNVYCPGSNDAPIAQDVAITGTLANGNTLVGSYTYFDADGNLEQNSILNWYTIDSAQDTNYVSLNNNTDNLVLTDEHIDKYIVFGVTPKAQSGTVLGEEFYSDPLGPVMDRIVANINEFHYENQDRDQNEFVEIRVDGDINNQPTDIGSYKIIQYRRAGTVVSSVTLERLTKTCDSTHCYYVWEHSLQNSTTGIALINHNSQLIEFLSYEGVVTATEGDADGETSTDIGVSQSNSSTPLDSSLFLDSDGTWKASNGSNTKGTANY